MIDYNKLKQAHKLGAILSSSIDYPVFIAVQQEERFEGEICVLYTFRAAGDASIYRNIDDLIAKLQELTQPKPKYEVGQEVHWINISHQIKSDIIWQISEDARGIIYHFDKPNYSAVYAAEVYPTKQALIESQIRYWAKLGAKEPDEPEPEECPHDKKIMGLGNDFICKHCDEYVNNEECEHDYQPNNYGQSNLEYQCTKCKVWKECQHESDGEVNLQQYSDMSARTEYFKCKKCGE